MNNFTYCVPTKFHFGRGAENDAGALLKGFGATKVLIHYGGGSAVRSGLIGRVEKSLDESTVKSMLLTLAKNYSSDIEVDFSDADARKLSSFVMGEFKKQLSAGVKVESDKGVKFGFRIKLDGGKVTHEFTEAAMADALSALLRPQLARVVNAAAQAK